MCCVGKGGSVCLFNFGHGQRVSRPYMHNIESAMLSLNFWCQIRYQRPERALTTNF
ncbi:hypothetical protein WN55_08860 [Dufourea novaeangliae]|uniref:Uncharacterized protein n=1 Tax=Dufourea novaeangliae TaxID=178035 RepID=A0A154P085_DUFNO|nr:hypothetical protein WN55_08860 [Dufourea novaeangliae]